MTMHSMDTVYNQVKITEVAGSTQSKKDHFTLVSLWCEQMGTYFLVTWLPKFLGCMDDQIFLPMVLRYYSLLSCKPQGQV